MYSLVAYGAMLADAVRIKAYQRALQQIVKPGMVVLEIGTGPGIFAVLACQLGAKRVYAIESNSIIQLARGIAAANHCSDKIEFIEEISTRVTMPIQADLIVSDLRGILPLLENLIPSIADARRRFLAPGGSLIGRKDHLHAAVVEAPDAYEKIVGSWEHNVLGQDLNLARQMSVNNFHRLRPARDQLLTNANLWRTLDYSRIEDPDIQGELTWTAKRDGVGHGIVVWFDADLADGVGFSNSPGSPETIYGSMFLPWRNPVPLLAGQTICVNLQAKLLEKEYSWRWGTRIEVPGRPAASAIQFDQSQLKGALLSPAKLRRCASNHIPVLTEEGLIRRRVVELIDGRVTLEDIARRLSAEFPERFARWQQALYFAVKASEESTR
jgi:type I protein arginine methyltransferase